MKRILISALLASAASVAVAAPITAGQTAAFAPGTAVQACDGSKAGTGKFTVFGGSGKAMPNGVNPLFTQQGWDIQCSANVHLYYLEADATTAAVAGGSAKSAKLYAGSTNGGSISYVGDAADKKAVKDTDVSGTGVTKAKALAAGSS